MTATKINGDVRPSLNVIDRRRFLKVTALSGVGFMIGCTSEHASVSNAAAQAPLSVADLNAFVRIASDNTVTVIVKHLDKGQGVTTGLPAVVAEELDADWSQMKAEFAPADPSRYNNLMFGPMQATGGSTSMANSWMQLREAAAGAREMLVRAAANRWGVVVEDVTVTDGVVRSGEHSATFGDLAEAAGQLSPPAEVTLKSPADFKLIGTNLPRTDSAAKTDGTAKFTIDQTRPGMLIAVVARPPRFGARVASYDDSAALKVPGVSRTVEIPRGIAVLADSYFSATRGRQALSIDWDNSDAEMRSSDELFAEFAAQLEKPGAVSRNDGDVGAAFDGAAEVIEADFEFPFLAHAAMEPLDCVIELSEDRCEVWTASQSQSRDQTHVAEVTGLNVDQVFINVVFAGGSFGRRSPGDNDFVSEAATIAVAINGESPVKLQWSREDDMSGGQYRPMALHRIRAALDSDRRLLAWDQRIVAHSIVKGTPAEHFMQNGIEPTIVEGSTDLPYAVDNFYLDSHIVPNKVPVLWWRSVGHTHNAYATEVFFDRIAVAMDRDPYELRRELLLAKDGLDGKERYIDVLDLAAREADWGAPLAAGRGRGIALHKSFNTYVAQVAEVSVSDDGDLTIDRIVCAVDCGIAVTPDVVKAQMEGGIGYGLSAALREAITLENGIVNEQNFHQYQPLRINEMPTIEVHIVASTEAPTGVGEPGTPPAAAALANAIANSRGQFITTLPFADQIRAG